MTKEVKEKLKEKFKLYKVWQNGIKNKVTNVSELKKSFQMTNNKFNHLLRKTKRNHFRQQIEENRNDSKKLWDVLKQMIETKKFKKRENIELDPNLLNDSFINSAIDLTKHFVDIERGETNIENNYHSIIGDITEEEVMAYISKLKNSKSCGSDGISAKMLKISIPALLPHIACLFNLIIKTNTFPDLWKISSITPIFKSGDRREPTNYRPISVLPVLSKVIEKHIFSETKKFLDSKQLLNEKQFGF